MSDVKMSRVNSNGQRCKTTDFQNSKNISDVFSKEEVAEIEANLSIAKRDKTVYPETMEDKENGDKYAWHSVGHDKYGRVMYCINTKIFRFQTMGEYYGTSTVD